jgi:hypothetical protein
MIAKSLETNEPMIQTDVKLLAVDLGLRAGLAAFSQEGILLSYRSCHFPSRSSLKRGVYLILNDYPELTHLVIEGGGDCLPPWEKEAKRRHLSLMRISAEKWRQKLLLQRQRKSGKIAKCTADKLARQLIDSTGAKKPTSLRHDAAEAILIGLWAVLELNWLATPPA